MGPRQYATFQCQEKLSLPHWVMKFTNFANDGYSAVNGGIDNSATGNYSSVSGWIILSTQRMANFFRWMVDVNILRMVKIPQWVVESINLPLAIVLQWVMNFKTLWMVVVYRHWDVLKIVLESYEEKNEPIKAFLLAVNLVLVKLPPVTTNHDLKYLAMLSWSAPSN